MNILKKYRKDGVIVTGSDNIKLDSPEFEIVSVLIDTVEKQLHLEVMYEVKQGSLIQKQYRTFDVAFGNLPDSVKATGLSVLQAIEQEILKLPQYVGSVEV